MLFSFLLTNIIFANVISPSIAKAQTASDSKSINVNATVGAGITISISGLASPNASIVAIANGQFLASTTADANGLFSITDIAVNLGNTNICFTTIDFKKIGESVGCLDTGDITKNTNITNVYLPPTIGLLKKQITAGQETVVFGYSMPNSTISIVIENGQTITTTTDSSGYYQYKYQAVAAGKFTFKSSGNYQNAPSLDPQKGVTLEAISPIQAVSKKAQGFLDFLKPLAFVIFTLILLGIILFLVFLIRRRKKEKKPVMHHDWLLKIEEKEKPKN